MPIHTQVNLLFGGFVCSCRTCATVRFCFCRMYFKLHWISTVEGCSQLRPHLRTRRWTYERKILVVPGRFSARLRFRVVTKKGVKISREWMRLWLASVLGIQSLWARALPLALLCYDFVLRLVAPRNCCYYDKHSYYPLLTSTYGRDQAHQRTVGAFVEGKAYDLTC